PSGCATGRPCGPSTSCLRPPTRSSLTSIPPTDEVPMATRASYRTPGPLPSQTSGFVGREAELGRARELLRRSRLVTITGPGGVGKSRLAVRAAGEAADRFRDGAYVAELSAVHDPALLVHALVARLAIPGLSTAESDQ